MILPAARGNLDRPHQGSEPPGLLPIEAGSDSVEQAGPVCIAAAGRIHDRLRLGTRDIYPLPIGVNDRALGASSQYERLELGCELLELATGSLFEHPALVVVYGHIACLLDEAQQLLAREHGKPLTRVEHERDAEARELARVLKHAVAPVGSDDCESCM